jgi:Flp pilus assembly protein TadD
MERLGQGEDAARLLQAFAESGQGTPGVRADLGWFFLTLHDPEKAKGIFLELAEREGDPRGFHGLAALLLGMGRIGDAKVIMAQIADAFPRDPLIQVNHGMALAKAGGARELADAAISAKRALSLSPRFGPAHTCLGIIASRQGRMDAAEEHFTEAIRLSDPAGHRNLGLLACARERWEVAEPHLLRALHRDPLDARAWAGLGALALQAGRAEEAVPLLMRASTLDPHDTGATRGLALALARGGDLKGAEEAIRKALGSAHDPGRSMLLLDLAALLISTGGLPGNQVLDEEAWRLLAEAGTVLPGEPEILFYRGIAEGRLGDPKEAVRLFASAMEHKEYRIPSQENIRRLKARMSGRMGSLAVIASPRSALALFSLLQLAAAWSFFVAKLISETAFLLLVTVFSALFALVLFLPARNGAVREETPVELVMPERTFIPVPEADMVAPFAWLRTSLRPRS